MKNKSIEENKEYFLGLAQDIIGDLCYYNRRDCEELSTEDVNELLDDGHVSLSEIFDKMRETLKENFPKIKD